MSELKFTYEEILEEVARISRSSVNGFTIEQMSDETGRSKKWCTEQVGKLIKSGRVEYVGRLSGRRIDGVPCLRPAYRFVQEKKTRKNAKRKRR